MENRILNIEGMTCAACAKTIERVSKKLPGVEEASVNIATEKLKIIYDDSKIKLLDIQNAVEKAGYKILVETTNKTLRLEGMTCDSCAKNIERITRKINGVIESNVNFATEKLTISFEPSLANTADIKKAIAKGGYKALEEESNVDTDKERKEKEIKALWNRFLISAIFGVPLLLIAMIPMITGRLNFMLPGIIDPMRHLRGYAILELILVLPIMVTGRRYFVVGFKSLARLSPNMDSLISMGTSAAFLYSIFAVYEILLGNTGYQMYFESAGVIFNPYNSWKVFRIGN